MKKQLIEILESLGYPAYLQGSLSDLEYPDSFFTFWNFDNPEQGKYNNKMSLQCVYGFWIYFYSTDPELVEATAEDLKKALELKGWIMDSKAVDAKSDEITHTGFMLTTQYVKNN